MSNDQPPGTDCYEAFCPNQDDDAAALVAGTVLVVVRANNVTDDDGSAPCCNLDDAFAVGAGLLFLIDGGGMISAGRQIWLRPATVDDCTAWITRPDAPAARGSRRSAEARWKELAP